MSATTAAPGRPRTLLSQEAYELVSGTVYTGLVTNALLVVACLPLVVVLVATDLRATWPLLAVLSPLLAPAVVAAFAVFRAFSQDGTTAVVRTFASAYRAHGRRALAVGALASGAVVVLAVDVAALWGTRAGAAVIPFFGTLAVLVVATTVLALAAVAEPTPAHGAGLGHLLRHALLLAVRRWYVSAASLVLLATLAAAVLTKPALGLGVLAAPVLFVVWGACRHALKVSTA